MFLFLVISPAPFKCVFSLCIATDPTCFFFSFFPVVFAQAACKYYDILVLAPSRDVAGDGLPASKSMWLCLPSGTLTLYPQCLFSIHV